MKWMASFFTVFVAATAAAVMAVWTPFNVLISEDIFDDAFRELRHRRDPMLIEVERHRPNIQSEINQVTLTALVELAQSTIAPFELKNDSAFVLLSRALFPSTKTYNDLPKHLPGELGDLPYFPDTYRICEVNPTDLLCADSSNNLLRNTFIRRLISTPSFVRNICPAMAQAMSWTAWWEQRLTPYYLWEGLHTPRSLADLKALADDMRPGLQMMATAPWSSTVFTPQTNDQEFLYRRYLDGGPELAQASLDCLDMIENQMLATASQKAPQDPKAADYINELLEFKEFSFPANPSQTRWVQTKRLNSRSLARLFRLYEPSQTIPQTHGLGRRKLKMAHYLGLAAWLTDLDMKHSYRFVTIDEFKALNPGPMACAASKDYTIFGLDGLQFEPLGNSLCDYSNIIFVRSDR